MHYLHVDEAYKKGNSYFKHSFIYVAILSTFFALPSILAIAFPIQTLLFLNIFYVKFIGGCLFFTLYYIINRTCICSSQPFCAFLYRASEHVVDFLSIACLVVFASILTQGFFLLPILGSSFITIGWLIKKKIIPLFQCASIIKIARITSTITSWANLFINQLILIIYAALYAYRLLVYFATICHKKIFNKCITPYNLSPKEVMTILLEDRQWNNLQWDRIRLHESHMTYKTLPDLPQIENLSEKERAISSFSEIFVITQQFLDLHCVRTLIEDEYSIWTSATEGPPTEMLASFEKQKQYLQTGLSIIDSSIKKGHIATTTKDHQHMQEYATHIRHLLLTQIHIYQSQTDDGLKQEAAGAVTKMLTLLGIYGHMCLDAQRDCLQELVQAHHNIPSTNKLFVTQKMQDMRLRIMHLCFYCYQHKIAQYLSLQSNSWKTAISSYLYHKIASDDRLQKKYFDEIVFGSRIPENNSLSINQLSINDNLYAAIFSKIIRTSYYLQRAYNSKTVATFLHAYTKYSPKNTEFSPDNLITTLRSWLQQSHSDEFNQLNENLCNQSISLHKMPLIKIHPQSQRQYLTKQGALLLLYLTNVITIEPPRTLISKIKHLCMNNCIMLILKKCIFFILSKMSGLYLTPLLYDERTRDTLLWGPLLPTQQKCQRLHPLSHNEIHHKLTKKQQSFFQKAKLSIACSIHNCTICNKNDGKNN